MSLVLEALKKQEANSDPDAAVSLARSAAQHRRHRLWVGLFAVAMALNAALLVWIFAFPVADQPAAADAGAGDAGAGVQARAVSPDPTPVAPVPVHPAPADPAPATPSRPAPAALSRPAPAAVRPTAGAAAATEPAGPVRVTLGDLPDAARARFPGIAFSTHIYAEDPELRAVVANGQRLREGDRIRGLEIVEITESGVLLAFERYRVEVPMATDWDSL